MKQIDVPIEIEDDAYALYEQVAAARGLDVEMVIGLDIQGLASAHFDDLLVQGGSPDGH